MGALTFLVRTGHSVHIGEDVRVTVVHHGRGGLRLRIEAPESVEVDRDVVRERKVRDGRRAKPLDDAVLVRCRTCDQPVEEARTCYAIPTCYACLPPPEPLPIVEKPSVRGKQEDSE